MDLRQSIIFWKYTSKNDNSPKNVNSPEITILEKYDFRTPWKPNRNDNQSQKQYQEILSRLESQYVENIGSDIREKGSCLWKLLANGGSFQGSLYLV